MSLTSAINTAVRGLNVAQEGVSVASHNIANINTPGYVSQKILQESLVTGDSGQGAKVIGVLADVDEQLLKSLRNKGSTFGSSTAVKKFTDTIDRLYGKPGEDNGLAFSIDQFFAQMQALNDNPDFISSKFNAVDAAKNLATEISSLARSLETTRLDIDQEISQNITTINGLLTSLAASNSSIGDFPEKTSGRINIEQNRNNDLQKLAEHINISTVTNGSGVLSITAGSGTAVLDASSYKLEYTPAASVDTFINNNALSAITVSTLDSAGNVVAGSAQTLVTSAKSASITSTIQDGSIKGLLSLRDVEIPKFLAQLDELSRAITDEVNKIHNDGSSFPPPSQLTGALSTTNNTTLGFSGKVQIAVVNNTGTPVSSPYSDEATFRPLTLDLSTLNSGSGAGKPTVQTIIDEINDFYGPLQNRAVINNLRDLKIVANADSIADGGNFTFDMELDNTSKNNANVVVNSITVIDPIDSSTGYGAATLPNPNSYNVAAGARERTGISMTANFGTDNNRASYTVRLNVTVTDTGVTPNVTSTANVDFTVSDNISSGNLNKRYTPQAVTLTAQTNGGTASFITAPSSTRFATAALVDANGNSVSTGQPGFLKITTTAGQNYGIAINELDSQEVGLPTTPTSQVTNKGFSHYFQLNDLFTTNSTTKGSAINMSVRSDIASNPNLISIGELTLSNQPIDTTKALYTYELGSGNTKIASRIAALDQSSVSFSAAGTISSLNVTIADYSSTIVGFAATFASTSTATFSVDEVAFDGLLDLFQESSGVSTDKELADIIEFENHYRASARVVSAAQEMFRVLTTSLS
ncbi:flagellar hook-associated protein FlgK [Rickettsiales bacterium]|nr:flagellar hook-associated protein FlgK [Rickettsiales bacterium]